MATSLPHARGSLSCDRCRIRKIKCIRSERGDCEGCIKTGQHCHSSSTKRSRPYYQTSKEQYELMTRIVHHFLPDIPLETNNLRQAVANLSKDDNARIGKQSQEIHADKGPPDSSSCPSPTRDGSACQNSPSSSLPSVRPVFDDRGTFVDAMAIMRFATGSSGAVFYQHIRQTLARSRGRLLQTQPTFRLDTFDSDPGPVIIPLHLPPRDLVDQAALKFFAEVNAGNGILDYVQFHNNIEQVYQNSTPVTQASLRIMHLVLALGQDSDEWFEKAAEYAPGTLREGSLQSIQALMLSTLFHLGRNHRNMAWIDTGCAVRIAQSLGLHLTPDTSSTNHTGAHSQIWWALHNMETFLSCMLGRPPGILEDHVSTSNHSGVQIQDPWTPQEYAAASVSLTQIICRLLRRLYGRQSDEDHDLAVKEILDRLQKWWDGLPVYLRPGRPTAPSYVRAITHLGLRYHHAIMLLTRPYLLLSVDNEASDDEQWKACVTKCENSNRESIVLLKEMARLGLLSQLSFSDAYYIIANGSILFLRCLKTPSDELVAEMKELQPLFSFTERNGVGQWGTKSYDALLEAIRVLNLHERAHTTVESPFSGSTLVDPLLEIDQLEQMVEGFWEASAFTDVGYVQLDDILL
ncbi:hypothetical protein EDB81DRAFT_143830 [Dactylonectria macrodidyma]|uniref:Zn(2)-C6 fungal-type domain-containing protein n=1 Tax=Dactylonectria macrodidyma TaxID=307937 RepID=A0A9P9DYQ3_9HYPO|nr:hypothetical protein EDB81DRAFT_143830 [Dactylonectria macrodidyma]